MAQQTLDQIVKSLEKSNQLNGQVLPCRTAHEPLLPPSETRAISGILPPEFSHAAVMHFCANEWAVHLDDIMMRRTSWHFYCSEAARMAEQVAQWMQEFFGWSKQTRDAELEHYLQVGRQRVGQGIRF